MPVISMATGSDQANQVIGERAAIGFSKRLVDQNRHTALSAWGQSECQLPNPRTAVRGLCVSWEGVFSRQPEFSRRHSLRNTIISGCLSSSRLFGERFR